MPATWQSSIVSITDRAAWSAAHPDQSFFEERPEYPTLKWQEALVNAVVHRDYATQGQTVEVWLYSDRLEISSPGAPPDGVSLDDLNEGRPAHVTRNPRIARVLADLEIMRDQGEGIRRMFEEMLESYLSPPALDLDHGRFRVVLRKEPIAAYDELRAGGWVEMERARGV